MLRDASGQAKQKLCCLRSVLQLAGASQERCQPFHHACLLFKVVEGVPQHACARRFEFLLTGVGWRIPEEAVVPSLHHQKAHARVLGATTGGVMGLIGGGAMCACESLSLPSLCGSSIPFLCSSCFSFEPKCALFLTLCLCQVSPSGKLLRPSMTAPL